MKSDGFRSLVPPLSVDSKYEASLRVARQTSVFKTLFESFGERRGS